QDFASVIVQQQQMPNGNWPWSGYDPNGLLSTAWAVLTLERFAPPPTGKSVYVDIKPGSWPNPINTKDKGVIPVAICGTEDFDIYTIDPSTIKICIEGVEEGVAPLRWSYEDVATPWTGEEGGGQNLKGDGYLDLCLKFSNQEVVTTLVLSNYIGQTIPLIITGNLKEEYGGLAILGHDYVRIIK
ncbi:MAG: hypothetical protein MUO82_08035, partial [Candidatus Thermoplasmatota archaeon]|nr:hypothetical protein [Candidatus Thermoplasmatota archaeon]